MSACLSASTCSPSKPLSTQQAAPKSRTELCSCLQHEGTEVLGRKRVVNKLCFPFWCAGESWGFEVQREQGCGLALVLPSCVTLGERLRLPELHFPQPSRWDLSTEQICEGLLVSGAALCQGYGKEQNRQDSCPHSTNSYNLDKVVQGGLSEEVAFAQRLR